MSESFRPFVAHGCPDYEPAMPGETTNDLHKRIADAMSAVRWEIWRFRLDLSPRVRAEFGTDDLLQAAWLWLIKADHKFVLDPNRAGYQAWARVVVRWHLRNLLRRRCVTRRKPLEIDPADDESLQPLTSILDIETACATRKAVHSIHDGLMKISTEQRREALERRHGLNGRDPKTVRQIARMMRVPVEKAEALIEEAESEMIVHIAGAAGRKLDVPPPTIPPPDPALRRSASDENKAIDKLMALPAGNAGRKDRRLLRRLLRALPATAR